MGRMDLNGRINNQSPPPEEFPALHSTNGSSKTRRGAYNYPHDELAGHGRFAAAVKKPVSPPLPAPMPTVGSTTPNSKDLATLAARREALGTAAEPLNPNTAIVAPRPSPRIKLRPPTLVPPLPTSENVSSLYAAYRNRAQQLGASRNECLGRAAAAWKKGDGAAAKRYSREGHDLNAKMSAEMVQAAGKLVRERAKLAELTMRATNSTWLDDAGDRAAPGKLCGAGLGVCLGIAAQTVASQLVSEGKKLSPEERTEVMADMHGLQAAEATEVMEEFLLAVSDRAVKSAINMLKMTFTVGARSVLRLG